MTEGQVLDVMRDGFYNIIICSAPNLGGIIIAYEDAGAEIQQ